MLKADVGSEAVAPGLQPEVDALKRFSSQQYTITSAWLRPRLLGQGRVNMRNKNKPMKMPVIMLLGLKNKFHASALPHNTVTTVKIR